MSNCTEATNRLPSEAKQAIWQIFGNGESPSESKTTYELADSILRNLVRKSDEAQKAIAEIQSWFEPVGDKYVLKQEMRKPVSWDIIAGVRRALLSSDKVKNRDTAFWAIGSVHPETSASIMRQHWSSGEIKTLASYAMETLERLSRDSKIIDPASTFGNLPTGTKWVSHESEQYQDLRGYEIVPDTGQHIYPGVKAVVALLLELNPKLFTTLINKVNSRILQSDTIFYFLHAKSQPGCQQPLGWISHTSSKALIAFAIVKTIEDAQKRETRHATAPSPQSTATPDGTASEKLITDLVDKLSSLDPTESTWWIFELLNYTSYGPSEKRPTVEQVDQSCTQLLKDIISQHWSDDLASELQSGLRRAQFEPRGKPLADIAWEIQHEQPEKAGELSRILLDEHERRMNETVTGSLQFPYITGRWSHLDWLLSIAAAAVIYHKEIDPTEWSTAKCEKLPLSAWDADENWKSFLQTIRVAQTQITIGLFGVQLLEKAGRPLDQGKLRAFAEKAWDHDNFVRHQYSDIPIEESEAAELAARVAVVFGEPDPEWVLKQANKSAVDPRSLWALLDQMKCQGNTTIDDDDFAEMRNIASHRYINAEEANPQMAPHLVNLWVLLDAPEEAAKTAKLLLAYNPIYTKESRRHPRINRDLLIPALKMLAFAESRGELADEMVKTSRSLYDNLWERYTPPDEKGARQHIDALLNRTAPKENARQECE